MPLKSQQKSQKNLLKSHRRIQKRKLQQKNQQLSQRPMKETSVLQTLRLRLHVLKKRMVLFVRESRSLRVNQLAKAQRKSSSIPKARTQRWKRWKKEAIVSKMYQFSQVKYLKENEIIN